MSFLNYLKASAPAAVKVPQEKIDSTWKRLRFQTFMAGTFGYALYYVCRLSMGVMKQPLIDAGLLNATQLGIIGACLYWAYAIGKLINGFLADSSNIKRFMASGLLVSVLMNFIMGVLGVTAVKGAVASSTLFVLFAVCWALNGWAQSMGAPAAVVSLSRWFPIRIRGTYYGFFSSSHNIGEGLSFIFVGMLVASFGWKWGFFGAALAGVLGILIILFFLHDSTEAKGLPPIEVLSGESEGGEVLSPEQKRAQTRRMQAAVIKNPAIIGINPIFGIIGTVVSGWLSDAVFKGDRKYPAFAAGILEALALALFLFGGPSKWVNVIAMVLFGIAIGVLISFLGGLMAVDLVPRQASGAALGVVGIASYVAAGLQNVVTGLILDNNIIEVGGRMVHDFTYASWFWLGAACISFLLPVLNWKRKQQSL